MTLKEQGKERAAELTKIIYTNVVKILASRELSQRQLAKNKGIDVQLFNGLIKRKNYTIRSLAQLAFLLDVTEGDLLVGIVD